MILEPAIIKIRRPYFSLAVFAWNEERAIGTTLASLFAQSVFEWLARRGALCEVTCVVNGCTDRTPAVAEEFFQRQRREHPFAGVFNARVINIPERGKLHAWNRFVHEFSAREAQFLFMMDADILLHEPETLANMLLTLEEHPESNVSVDEPRKDISFKARKSLAERLSLKTSRLTLAAPAQLCGQLYCIRSAVARNIYLPKDLAACEDGFIKTLVCTDSLTRKVAPHRIRLAPRASHTFEAYTSLPALIKNQRRQIIGQTIVHILADQYLKDLPLRERGMMARHLKEKEARDPLWLKRLIAQHVRRKRMFWQLYPGVLSQRFRSLRALSLADRVRLLPAALAGFLLSLLPCALAYVSLRRGATDYWPKAQRAGLELISLQSTTRRRQFAPHSNPS